MDVNNICGPCGVLDNINLGINMNRCFPEVCLVSS